MRYFIYSSFVEFRLLLCVVVGSDMYSSSMFLVLYAVVASMCGLWPKHVVIYVYVYMKHGLSDVQSMIFKVLHLQDCITYIYIYKVIN
jgi:hypothetical protein